MISRREEMERYHQLMGSEATARQVIEAQNRRQCCGTHRLEEHHPDCNNHPRKRVMKQYRRLFGDKETQVAAKGEPHA